MLDKIEYIENKIKYGIKYDWRKIRRLYDSLGVPDDVYKIPWEGILQNQYIIGLSERSTGKTTGWLLVGMCMHELYGSVTQYIRATEDELKPSHAEKLVEVIRTYDEGRYVKKITNNRWNDIYYHWKQFFYCNRDETGVIVEKSDKPFIQCLSVDNAMDYKSSYNAPTGDLILFDEFVGKFYRPDEAIQFLDLCCTIIRDRRCPHIVMMANTINLNSMYFEELEISRKIRTMKKGDSTQIITEKGTQMYVEIVDVPEKSDAKSIINRLFFGFKSEKLASITGEQTWAFDSVQHIPKRTDSWRCINNRIYIETGTELLKCDFCYTEELGYHLEVHKATQYFDDSIILTLANITDRQHYYGFGPKKLNNFFSKVVAHHQVYFSSNEVGSIFNDYIKRFSLSK